MTGIIEFIVAMLILAAGFTGVLRLIDECREEAERRDLEAFMDVLWPMCGDDELERAA